MLDPVGFLCIHCLQKMDEIVSSRTESKSPGLISCPKCTKLRKTPVSGDHYFEYPDLIIILDLLAMNKKTFNHLVFNKKLGKRPLQLALLGILSDAFRRWTSSDNWTMDSFTFNTLEDVYRTQLDFYQYAFHSVWAHAISLATLLPFALAYLKISSFLRAFLLTLSIKIVFIPLLIWTPRSIFFLPCGLSFIISFCFQAMQVTSLLQADKRHSAKVFLFAVGNCMLSTFIQFYLNF